MATSPLHNPNQARVMIWSPPRSMSTAFARSMSARGDTEVFWEPYLACYMCGPDRKVDIADNIPGMLNDKYTYSYIKGLLNASYSDAKVLFVKGMIQGIRENFDVADPNYTHTFLIRHPRKMFASLDKMLSLTAENFEQGGRANSLSDYHIAFKNIYHDLEEFYHHVQTKFNQPSPPIIDADDVIAHPDKVLPKYCEAVGIEFTPKMLKWDSVDPSELNWHCTDVGGMANAELLKKTRVLSNAMTGQGFGKAPDLATESATSPFVEEYAEYAMPVYERLHQLRIKP